MSAESNLITLLEQNFNEDELRQLCLDVKIPFESLSGNNNKRKAYEMVGYVKRRDQVDLLIERIAQERPHLKPQLNNIAQQTEKQSVDSHNQPILLVGMGIVLVIILILGAWWASSFFSPETTAPQTAVPNETFLYQIRVQEQSNNQPIENANVTLDLPGTTPVNEFTDSTGLAAFRLNKQFANSITVLHVTKDGYEGWDQNIAITEDEHPQEIKLEKVP